MDPAAIAPIPSPIGMPTSAPSKPAASISLTYAPATEAAGYANGVVSVPAGTYRPDQPALQLKITGSGTDLAVTAVDADGTERTPNPSEVLVARDQLFKAFESTGLSPDQKRQVERSLNMVCMLFSATTPNKEAYMGSVLGGAMPNPAEVGTPRGTFTFRPEDNAYFRKTHPTKLMDPIEIKFNTLMRERGISGGR